MTRDLALGVRHLVRQPGFAAVAILSLAIGIGLNTTLFSVVNAVLFRDAPVADRDRLVEIYTGNAEYPQLTTSYLDYLDVSREADALEAVAAHAFVRGILSGGDRPALVTGEAVSANYFDVLGVRVPHGRGFVAAEAAQPGAEPVAVVSHALWQQRYGGRPDLVGQTISLSSVAYTVIGIAPPNFEGTLPGIATDFWVPLTMIDHLVFSGVQWTDTEDPGATRLERRGTRWLFVKGRLAEGRLVEQARAQIDTIFARLRSEYPATNANARPSVVPASDIRFHPMLDGYVRAASAGLLAAVALVLLIACANVANLLLARGSARRRELAVRMAIGAGRGAIVRQLLAESLVLAGAGGALGLLIAWWAGRALAGLGTDVFPVPVSFEFTIDPTVAGFALLATLATALVFGLLPALSASRPDIVPALKGMPSAERRSRFSMRDTLVVAQLAMSLTLLVCGALLTRGLIAARHVEIGFDPAVIASLSFNLQMNGYDVARATTLRDRAVEALSAVPGVRAVSYASRLPLSPDINVGGVIIPGYHAADDQNGTTVDTVRVGGGYFDAVGVPIVAGRAISDADVREERRVAVVNQAMADMFWPDGNALGARLYLDSRSSEPHEVIGIARDHKVRSVGEPRRAYLHLPAVPSRGVGLIVRTATPAEATLPALRQALWALEPAIVFTEDVSAAAIAETTMAPTAIGAMVVGVFGALALALATVGLYGVVVYTVSRRTREVGIRMAIGATRGQVLRLIVSQGARLALVGIVIGGVGAALAGRMLESLLYGIGAADPLAFAIAAGALLLVVLVASAIPARAAARVDPLTALRAE